MANKGALNASLNAGQSYTVPVGYTTGGKITANSLASQTSATATAGKILSGSTAWVNGSKITGTIVNRGTLDWSPTTSTTYTVPAGYYSGGTLNSTEVYNKGIIDGRVGYYTKEEYDANYTAGYNAGVTAGKNNATVVVSVWGVGGSSSSVGSRSYTLTYPNTGSYSQGDGDTKVSIRWQ